MSFLDIAKTVRTAVQDNSPAILTGLGIASVFTTPFLAVKATPEALRRIWDAETEHNRDISTLEKVKLVWPLYIPAAAAAASGTACILLSNRISSRRTAVALGALSISENSYREYRDKTRVVVGEKQEKKIREEIAQDHVNAKLEELTTTVRPQGKQLCLDAFTQRVFLSDYETLRKAQNDVNQTCLHEGGVALNEFYSRLDLEPIPMGYDLGWNTDQMLELELTSCLVENGEPAIHVAFHRDPSINYDAPFR